MNNQKNNRICFISPFAYPLLAGGGAGSGGAERQFFLFGRGLAAKGWRVSFITHKPVPEHTARSTVFPVYLADLSYLGGSKWQTPLNWLSLLYAMRRANADYYVIKVPDHLLPIMAAYCIPYQRKVVFWAQTTYDTNVLMHTRWSFVGLLDNTGIRFTDVVIAQSREQQIEFTRNYGRHAHLVRSICDRLAPQRCGTEKNPVDVLWVGNSLLNKRPEVVLALARRMPDLRFAMAMNIADQVRFGRIKLDALEIPNLEFLGQIPPFDMEPWFGQARLFLNTSQREGFPNTFLQAWMNGLPILSLNIDPDDIIRDHMLGRVVGWHRVAGCDEDPSKLADLLVPMLYEMLSNESRLQSIAVLARQYVADHHQPQKVTAQLIAALQTGAKR